MCIFICIPSESHSRKTLPVSGMQISLSSSYSQHVGQTGSLFSSLSVLFGIFPGFVVTTGVVVVIIFVVVGAIVLVVVMVLVLVVVLVFIVVDVVVVDVLGVVLVSP